MDLKNSEKRETEWEVKCGYLRENGRERKRTGELGREREREKDGDGESGIRRGKDKFRK